jgi:hypothetical protein
MQLSAVDVPVAVDLKGVCTAAFASYVEHLVPACVLD